MVQGPGERNEVPGLARYWHEARFVQARALRRGEGILRKAPLPRHRPRAIVAVIRGSKDQLGFRAIPPMVVVIAAAVDQRIAEVTRVPYKPPPQPLPVTPRPYPEAPVLDRGAVEREPQSRARLPRLRVEERRVLVARHLPPHPSAHGGCLLEDVHRLRHHRVDVPQLAQEGRYLPGRRVVRERPRAQVQSVPGLVKGPELAPPGEVLTPQAPRGGIDGVGLREEVDPRRAVEEVVRPPLRVDLAGVGAEDGDADAFRAPLLPRRRRR